MSNDDNNSTNNPALDTMKKRDSDTRPGDQDRDTKTERQHGQSIPGQSGQVPQGQGNSSSQWGTNTDSKTSYKKNATQDLYGTGGNASGADMVGQNQFPANTQDDDADGRDENVKDDLYGDNSGHTGGSAPKR